MPKFTLIAEHTNVFGNPDGTKINYEFYVDHLDNVLEHVDLFIRGCGYVPIGTLDYVPDDEYYGEPPEYQTQEWDTPQEEFTGDGHDGMGSTLADYENHSQYYFDTQRNK